MLVNKKINKSKIKTILKLEIALWEVKVQSKSCNAARTQSNYFINKRSDIDAVQKIYLKNNKTQFSSTKGFSKNK